MQCDLVAPCSNKIRYQLGLDCRLVFCVVIIKIDGDSIDVSCGFELEMEY